MITLTLEEFGGSDSCLEVDLDYRAWPGEPMVRYYPDGSGYPGSPPGAELIGVHVTSWTVNGIDRHRSDHWLWAILDEFARDRIEEHWETFESLCLEDATGD